MKWKSLMPARGFTLIELLVVVSIIAIAFSAFIMLGFSFSSPDDLLRQEQERLQARLQFAHEQGVMRGVDLGVRFNSQQYRFMRLQDAQWQEIADDKLLGVQTLPDNMQLVLELEGIEALLKVQDNEDATPGTNADQADADTAPENKIKPQVFLLSSGETTPDFTVSFRFAGADAQRRVHGDINGQYERVKN